MSEQFRDKLGLRPGEHAKYVPDVTGYDAQSLIALAEQTGKTVVGRVFTAVPGEQQIASQLTGVSGATVVPYSEGRGFVGKTALVIRPQGR